MAVKKKPQKYQQANAYYSHGSEAYEIEREYDPFEKAVKRKKQQNGSNLLKQNWLSKDEQIGFIVLKLLWYWLYFFVVH